MSLLLMLGCIKEYNPQYDSDSIQKYVIHGMVTDQEGWQEVNVSITSSTQDPKYIPVLNCKVEIKDDLGQKFILEPYENGTYRVWMNQEYLVPGRSYQVQVTSHDGQVMESSFDQMPTGPEIEEVYYQVEDHPTNDPDEWLRGIQYYINFQAHEEDSKFYRWQLTETWEFHSAYPIEFYYDGQIQHVFPPDYSLFYCWRTRLVDEVFTLSTQNLSDNSYEAFPLHFVRDNTERLSVYYSLLVKQIALSQEAFSYWDQIRINNSIGEGLYGSQPIAISGNITNTSDEDLQVLGFFQASSVSTKRLFTGPVEGLDLDFSDNCNPALLRVGLREITPDMYPGYLMEYGGTWIPVLLNVECVDCTSRFGVTTKPDYWPI